MTISRSDRELAIVLLAACQRDLTEPALDEIMSQRHLLALAEVVKEDVWPND